MENIKEKLYQEIEQTQIKVHETVESLLGSFTDYSLSLHTNIDRDFGRWSKDQLPENAYRIRCEVSIIKMDNSKETSSSFDLVYSSATGIEMNSSCRGSFNLKEDPEEVEKYKLMGRIWDNLDQVEKALSIFNIDCLNKLSKIRMEEDRLQREAYLKERKEKEAQAASELKVGNIYIIKSDFRNRLEGIVITKITNKCVFYYDATEEVIEENDTYVKTGRLIDTGSIYWVNCRINKDSFINSIVNGAYTLQK